MTAPKRQRNITPTAPAAAKPAAAPAAPAAAPAPAAADAELDDLLDEPLNPPAAEEPTAPAAAKPAAAPAAPAAAPAPAAADAELDDLLDEPLNPPAAEEPPPPAEPEPLTRKEAAKRAEEEKVAKKTKAVKPKVMPTDDFIRDKKGNIRKDADGDEMRYAPGFHKQVGFVTEAGVLFPVHFQFPGGFVGSFGNVILHKCPSCGYRNGIDEARSGVCGNQKCRFSQLEQLEQVEL